MAYWICYHNTDRLGHLPGDHEHRMDPATFACDGNTRGAMPCGIRTNKAMVKKARGDTVFLITGVGESPKKYFLWSWFVVDKVEEDSSDGSFVASGHSGRVLNPAPELVGEEFGEFKRANANFSLGFQNVSDHPFHKRLLELSEHVGDPTEKYESRD